MIYKSFFRKKLTKIYFIILVILGLTIITLLSFQKYYKEMKNNIYTNNTLMIIASNKDYKLDINKQEFVSNIEEAILFIPNKNEDNPFIDCSFQITDNNGNIISSNNNVSSKELIISWEELYIDNFEGNILVKPASSRNINLEDEQVYIGLRRAFYRDNNDIYDFQNYENKTVNFIFNNENLTFKLNGLYPSNEGLSPEILISDNMFNKLKNQTDLKIYTTKINDYLKANKYIEELKKIDLNSIFELNTFFDNNEGNEISNIYDVLTILNLVVIIAIIIFLIIYGVILKNIIVDLKDNIIIERKIGYNISQIKRNIFFRISLLISLSYIISLALNIILCLILNHISLINLTLPTINVIITIYIIIIIYLIASLYIIKVKQLISN